MLVNCVAYERGKKLADISREEISDYLKRPDTFVWVALFEPTEGELAEMQREFDLHELAVEDALHGSQRPKMDEYRDSLFVVLQTIDVVGKELALGEVDMFVGDNYVLSVRKGTRHGFANVRARAEREPHLLQHGSGFVMYALMDAVVDRYFPVLETLEEEFERIEDQIFVGGLASRNIQALYGLKQRLMVMKHAVAPLLEVVGKFYGGRVPKVCADTQEYYRDVHDHLGRIDQTTDSLREMVTTAISVSVSLIQLQENEVVKRLAAYGALIAVPTMIAGIYGMNFEFMPELHWLFGYPVSIAVMAAIDFYLFYRFRKAKWL